MCVSFFVYVCGCEHVFVCAYKYFQYGWYAMAAPVVGDKAVVQERFGVRLVSQFPNTINKTAIVVPEQKKK